jgi:hypothetical protein
MVAMPSMVEADAGVAPANNAAATAVTRAMSKTRVGLVPLLRWVFRTPAPALVPSDSIPAFVVMFALS